MTTSHLALPISTSFMTSPLLNVTFSIIISILFLENVHIQPHLFKTSIENRSIPHEKVVDKRFRTSMTSDMPFERFTLNNSQPPSTAVFLVKIVKLHFRTISLNIFWSTTHGSFTKNWLYSRLICSIHVSLDCCILVG